MGSDRVRVEKKSSSTLTPGFKPEKSSFLQPRYQDRVDRETDSVQEKQQNSSEQSNPTLPFLGHSFGRMSVLPIQAKLTIGQPNNKYEQEADRVAAQVVQQVNSPQPQQSGGIQRDAVNPEDDKSLQTKPVISTLQRETMPEEEEEEKKLQTKSLLQRQEIPEEEEELQMKPVGASIQRQEMPEEEEEEEKLQTKSVVQRRAEGSGVGSAGLEASIQGVRGQGQPLGDEVREPMEQAFGSDFSGVRVHANAQSDQLNKSIQARAFTTGRDIFFRQGEYQLGSRGGQELLAHELTHVVQQTGAISPKTTSEQPTIGQLDKFRNEKLSEDRHSLEVLSASAMIQKREVCDASGICWSEAGPEESAYADEPNASYSTDVGTLTESTTKQEEDPNQPVFEEYKGQSINKVGYVSSRAEEYEIAKTAGVNVRAKPDGTLRHIAKVLYGTKVQVQALDNTNAFYFIIADTGAVGWINKNFVALNPPDPGARLHHITESNLTTILKNKYIDQGLWTLSTGNDYTTLAAAVVVANEGRKGVDVDWEKAQKYKEEEAPLYKRWFDPWMIDNFAIYQGSKILKGHNIWLPSPDYVRMLQSSGVIGSRPGWINTAVDIGKGIAGFNAGMVSGIFGSLWDTLTGLWELGKGIVSTIKGALDGSLFASIKSIYDTVTNMTWEDFKNMVGEVITMGKNAFNNFMEQWEHPDTYKKWHFRGYTIGAIALEVVLAIFTGGGTLGAKVLAKIGKYFPKLKGVLNTLLKVADDLDFRRRGKGRGDKSKDRDDDRERDKDNENMSKADREWEQARQMAALITETHDAKDTPVDELISMLNATIAVKSREVHKYQENLIKAPNTYMIIQTARKKVVDKHYTTTEDNRAEIEQVKSSIRRLLKSPFLKRGKFAKAGGSIATNYPDIKDVPADERRKINEFGELYGDHHTGVPKPGTKGGWIPDHIPVTELVRTAIDNRELKDLMTAARLPTTLGRQRLYPHSLLSARTQGGVVTGIKLKLKKLKRLKLRSKRR